MRKVVACVLSVGALVVWVNVRKPSAGAQRTPEGDTPCAEDVTRYGVDVNGDETLDVSDAVYLLRYIFSGGPAPQVCLAQDGQVGVQLPQYSRDGLPEASIGGRLARVVDGPRGVWMDTGPLDLGDNEGDRRQWFALDGEVINVKEFGAQGDGTTDDTAAIEAAIDAVPDAVRDWPERGTSRPEHAATIFFPGTTGHYRVTRTITIPGNKNLRLLGPSSHSARLRLDGGTEPYIFRVAGGGADNQRAVIFEKLIFHKGGIEYEADNRRLHAIRDCAFVETPSSAIRTLGISVINVEVSRCHFSECEAGIDIAHEHADLWLIRHCAFVRLNGPALRIATSGVHVRDCDFEVSTNPDKPFVHVQRPASGVTPGGDVVFDACRFGNEATPPGNLVVFGPLDSVEDNLIQSVLFTNCVFRGATELTPTPDNGENVFLFNAPPVSVRVTNCTFWVYENIVNENYYDCRGQDDDCVTPAASGKPHDNVFFGNSFRAGGPVGSVFTRGGVGWSLEGQTTTMRALHPSGGFSARRTQNLLWDTDRLGDSPAWQRQNLSVVKDATGPDHVPGSAYTLEKLGDGSAFLRSPLIVPGVHGSVTGSVWLKAESKNTARLVLLRADGNRQTTTLVPLRLSGEWRRYDVSYKELMPNDAVRLSIFNGADGDNTPGSILAAFPQLEAGATATPYLDSPSAQEAHAPRQWQALQLGRKVIGYGSAPPDTGHHEQGDLVFNTEPEDGGSVGWVCTRGGNPGEWKTFGAIGGGR